MAHHRRRRRGQGEAGGFLRLWLLELAPHDRRSLQRAGSSLNLDRHSREQLLLEACADAHELTVAELCMLVPSIRRESAIAAQHDL